MDKIDKESDLFCFIVKLPRNINGDKIITNIIEFIIKLILNSRK